LAAERRTRLVSEPSAACQEMAQPDKRLKIRADYGLGKGDPLIVGREFALARHQRVRARIEEIEEAIERLDQGVPGICQSCGESMEN